MTICKLCKSHMCNTKAHIIPKWIYKSFLGDTEQFIIPNSSSSKPRITQAGIFDRHLVCDKCEKLFLDADTYSAKFFRDQSWNADHFTELISSDGVQSDERYFLRRIEGANFKLLKLFILNTLWRISHSSDPFFMQADLGKRSDYLSKLVLTQSTGDSTDFPFIIFKLLDAPDALVESQNFMMQPRIARGTDGHWYCKLSLPGFEIHICTDSRKSHGLPDPVLIQDSNFHVIGCPTSQMDSATNTMSVMRAHLKGRTKHLLTKRRSI